VSRRAPELAMISKSNKEGWGRLRKRYHKNGLALFLGAGVSYGSMLPDWEKLVRNLMQSYKQNDASEIFHKFQSAGFSLLTITEFIKIGFNDDTRFMSEVKNALYREFPCRTVLRTSKPPDMDMIIEHVETYNPTLAAVYDLATKQLSDHLIPNEKIPYIVNFNLDSLLEAYDSAKVHKLQPSKGRLCLHRVESAGATPIAGRTNVYHPHGYVRLENRTNFKGRESRSSVLSEYDYYNFYNEPTKIFTYTILSTLNQFSCLFIGMSMKDENIRRLLYYSKQERNSSRQVTNRSEETSPRHFAILKREDASIEELLTKTLSRLSVQPLWIRDFNEIPSRLRALKV
jgi:hypothetical protein